MPIDYKKYPPNWLKEIRPRIMLRAGNKCEFEGCGREHLSHVFAAKISGKIEWFKSVEDAKEASPYTYFDKPIKVVLTIAHLDHDETNHEVKDERLMAMCQIHHLRYDAKEKYRRLQLTNTKTL